MAMCLANLARTQPMEIMAKPQCMKNTWAEKEVFQNVGLFHYRAVVPVICRELRQPPQTGFNQEPLELNREQQQQQEQQRWGTPGSRCRE